MKLLICGDMSVTDKSWKYFDQMDVDGAFHDVQGVFKAADRVIVNLECAVTDSEEGITKIGPCLKGPVNTVKTLKKAGVTDCTLSNNHIFDFGKKGLADTVAQLEEQGLGYTGIGANYEDSRKDLILPGEGFTVAIINVCEHEYSYATENRIGARPFDEFETMEDIRQAKKQNKYVVVVYHGGKEHVRYPSPRLRKACREMVRCGADVVLCQHSHIIGCYEEFEGGHILYGQGNFHFAGRRPEEDWNEGLIAELTVTDAGIAVRYIPVWSEVEEGGIWLKNAEDAEKTLADMAARNEELADGRWKARWREFCVANFGPYNNARIGTAKTEEKKQQMFSHYLDCEAHRDVWMELFPTWNHTNELD